MPSVAVQQKAVSANIQRNNGLTIVNAGNVPATSPVTNSMGYVKILAFHPVSNGSRIPHAATPNGTHLNLDGSNVPTASAISGDYAKMTAGRYIIRRYTNFIAGNASTIFNSGCSDGPQRRSINRQIHGRATEMYGFSYVGGVNGSQPGGTATFTYSYSRMNPIWGNDVAATPTRAVPGDIVFRVSSNKYTVKAYTAKNT